MHKIMNLMPIDIVYAPDGDLDKAITIPKSGYLARLTAETCIMGGFTTNYGWLDICNRPALGGLYIARSDVEDVEENRIYNPYSWMYEQDASVFIVNIVVMQAMVGYGSKIILSPAAGNAGVIRDETGRILAVTHFVRFD